MGRRVANMYEHTTRTVNGVKEWKRGAPRREKETSADAREKMNKDVGNHESPATSSQDANYKFLYFGAAATTTRSSRAPASVSTTAITTTIDALSRSSAPWSAHWPLTTFLLCLNEDSDVPSGFSIDPDATMTTLTLRKRGDDCTLGRFKLLELEEGAGFITNNLEFLDLPETRGDGLSQRLLSDSLHHALDKALGM